MDSNKKNIRPQKRDFETAFCRQKISAQRMPVLDGLCLCAVMHYVGFRFLQQSTMFPLVYSDLYKYLTLFSLAVSGGIRFLYLLIQNLKEIKDRLSRMKYLMRRMVPFFFALPFFYVGLKHNYKSLVYLTFATLCLYEIEAKRVLRWFVWTVGILLSATVLSCLGGAIKNVCDFRNGCVQASYGMINTSDFASCFTFLILFIWCIQKNQGVQPSLVTFICCGLCGYAVYWLTESKTSLICCGMTLAAILWEFVESTVFRRRDALRTAGRAINCLSVISFPVLCAAFFIMTAFYSRQAPWAVQANQLLTRRLTLTLQYVNQYGVHPLGATVENNNGWGGTVIEAWNVNGYGYMDSAYASIAIRYGWIILLIVAGLWVWLTIRFLKHGETKAALAMGIISFHALSEGRFFDIHYNILLAMPFCSFAPARPAEEKAALSIRKEDGFSWVSCVSALLLGACVYLILPTALSWLRTVFYLKGWNTGIHTFFAFATSCGIVTIGICLWKAVSLLWRTRGKKGWLRLAGISALLALAVVSGNGVVSQGLVNQADRLNAEEEVIRLVQSVAVQPVYAAEASGLYQRRFGGFDGHFFSTEELYRPPRGTIFTDKSVESLGRRFAYLQYAQVSPWSGIYSYDAEVIHALEEAGYVWKTYYYSERSFDLEDLAVRNAVPLDRNNRLVLNGSEHSLEHTLEVDQKEGRYEVRFSLSLPQNQMLEVGQKVCSLLVMGESEQFVIAEQALFTDHFDSEGNCSFTITYNIQDTPKVSYRIEMCNDVQLLLEEIAWRNDSW